MTLVGPGGVGKTSLAVELGRRRHGRHDDGVSVVHLAPVEDPGDVIHVLRRDTELTDAGPGEDDLLRALAGLDALLILDNCEHLIDESARLVAQLLAGGGRVRIVATSRERLGLPGERVWPVAPLDHEAARDLLVDRARAIDPGWESDDTAALDRLLDLVDRLPLGVEMAAARLPVVGLVDLLELLEQRLDLLRSSDRRGEERHRTLPALVEWSEDLLEPATRRLLTDLSVFAGPIGAGDIAAVVDRDRVELVAGPLSDLVERSLIVADTSGSQTRYRLLETVRACVAPRRDQAVDAGHAEHVARVVLDADRRLRGPDEASGAERIAELEAEIRSAHRWAVGNRPDLAGTLTAALLHYAHERQWTEPAAWAEALLGADDPAVAAAAAASVAAEASNRGDYGRARDLAEQAGASSDPRVAASAGDTLANIGLYAGDLGATERHSEGLADLADRTGDRAIWMLAAVDGTLGRLYRGDVGGARSHLDRLAVPADLSPTTRAWLAYTNGELSAAEGQTDEAIAWFDQAVELGSSVGSRFVAGVARISNLALRSRRGEIDAALDAFEPVLSHYRRTPSSTHAITAVRNLIVLLVRAGHDRPAAELLGALSTPEAKATYGAESELLDEARKTIDHRNDPDSVVAWLATGTARGPGWALDHAIATLAQLAAGRSPTPGVIPDRQAEG